MNKYRQADYLVFADSQYKSLSDSTLIVTLNVELVMATVRRFKAVSTNRDPFINYCTIIHVGKPLIRFSDFF